MTYIDNIKLANNKPDNYLSDNKHPKYKSVLNTGLSWFAVDMAVGTAADTFHNSKLKTKPTAKILGKQA